MGQARKLCFLLLSGLFGATLLLPAAPVCGQPAPPMPPALPPAVAPASEDRPLPINLPTALKLADAQALDVATAAERIGVATALLEQAKVLWLPTITVGGDYNRHDGRNQDTTGRVFDNSRSSMMFGAGTGIGTAAILNVNDAIFAPLVARQRLQARRADRQAASNDTLVAVTDAYFTVQQARGELAGAMEATRRTEDLVRRTRKLAPNIVPELELDRAETELVRRQQAELLARERWGVASAELLRVLRLDPSAQVVPVEPLELQVELIDLHQPLDELIPVALTNRPELASRQAQVQATLTLLKQERLRPLIPSVLLRGFSTPVTGTLAGGVFAGGPGSTVRNAGARMDLDLQVLWQLDNLGFGNRGRIHQREAEKQLAILDLFRTEDRVAAEVAQYYTQVQMAARRVGLAERGVRFALASAEKNLTALSQTKAAGNQVVLIVRPQEAIASVQALAQAYLDYYGAVADVNRAQFRLYRALGKPAQCVLSEHSLPSIPSDPAAPAEALPPPRLDIPEPGRPADQKPAE